MVKEILTFGGIQIEKKLLLQISCPCKERIY